MNDTIEALVDSIQGGAQEDMAALWTVLQAEVRRQAQHWAKILRKRRPDVTAEDLYQCGYLALDQAVREYHASMGIPFYLWFLRLLRLEFARAAGHRAVRALSAEDASSSCGTALADALRALPTPLFRVLYLRYLLGFSQKEAGLLLEVSPETVAARENAGLRTLRKVLRTA